MKPRRQFLLPLMLLLLVSDASATHPIEQDFRIRRVQTARFERREDVWQAPNRRQGFDTYFVDDGIRLQPRGDEANWELELTLLRYGRDGSLIPSRLAEPAFPHENRMELTREGLVEWYVNEGSGLEQGFDIAERPAGPRESELILELGMNTDLHPVFSSDGLSVEFFSRGRLALRYSKLVVIDASGKQLSSRMEGFAVAGERGIRLIVDDRRAQYPIVVDPVVTTASWSAFGPTDDAAFGGSVAPAGDVNGDGFGDLIVGSPLAQNGQMGEGMAFVYLGSPSGLATTPVWSAESDLMNARFGVSVSTAGDVNADGYADVLVGCHHCDGPGSQRGQVFVYFGSPSGPSSTPDQTFSGVDNDEHLGTSVSTAGDFNGDGFSDVILGAPGFNGNRGRAYLYGGSALGLTTNLPVFEGQTPGENFGQAVAGGGDFDGDGFGDVAIAAPNFGVGTNDGKVKLVHGAPSGSGPIIATTIPTGATDAWFGAALAFVGDSTGDGTSDLAVGAPYEVVAVPATIGRVFVFSTNLSSYWSVVAPFDGASFGKSLASAGDIDDDGLAEVIIGDDNAASQKGRVWVFQNPAVAANDGTVWIGPFGNSAFDTVGFSVAGADVNGDGRPDMVVGATGVDEIGIDNKGEVTVYHSMPASGLSEDPVLIDTLSPTPSIGAVGDLNGDGFADVAAGYSGGDWTKIYHGGASGLPASPSLTLNGTTGSSFGDTLAGAGDVDGDGYEDLVVGSPDYNGGEGRVSLFPGSVTGPAATPVWTFASGQANSNLGYRGMAGLGDVNGDGYADVAVGAPNWTNGEALEGAVFVFLGSPTGFAVTYNQRLEVDQANAAFGLAIDSAGDVNGDGYSDLIVGANHYSNGQPDEGAAYLYLGGPGGLNAIPAWQAESNIGLARFGEQVAGAGDLNGDGFADIAVGTPVYSNPETEEGSVWVYYGGPSGPSMAPDLIVESDVGFIRMGQSVCSPGDVNGDGFSDLAIGGIGDVVSGLFFGSAAGLSTSASVLIPTGNQLDGADINGDGYSDVIAANPDGIDGFYTHGTDNLDRNRSVRLRRSDDSAPIAPLGLSELTTTFGYYAHPPAWQGRGDVAVEVEVKPMGVPFDGLGTISMPFTDNAAAPLLETVDTLAPGTLYHWRTRHRYDPVTNPWFLYGPWLPSPSNAWSEPDFRTAGNATASAVPDGDMVSGAPLTVAMEEISPGNLQIVLNWGDSCGGEATDYAIYTGTIGDFTSHVPCTCSTGGLTNYSYPPDEIQPQYYLVVPVNTAGQREGSYGVDGNGTPRPASVVACFPAGEPASCSP